MTAAGSGLRRCAIYTRVSSDGGLEQEFNSLHAQREAAEAYIKSQAHEGWRLRRDRYADGGFSGGSMDRPALTRLLADIAERRIDVVVVYKVDRLTRALADFAKLVELFDAHDVSFVSVTQSFNTTSSVGRLTLNVLLSFAQFEREVTGERIRDKIAASKKKGLWMGGTVPLGYRVQDRKLIADEEEANTVKLIYERYLALGSLGALQQDLRDRGIRSRARHSTSGKVSGGVPLTNGPLAHLLRNRMYLGEINHKDKSYPGDHAAIIDPDLFDAVQAKLASNTTHTNKSNGPSGAPLLGRLFDDRGNRMSPSYAMKGDVRYRYYVSTAVVQGRKADAGTIARISANTIESAVLQALRDHTKIDIDDAAPASLFNQIDLRVDQKKGELKLTWTEANEHDHGSNKNEVRSSTSLASIPDRDAEQDERKTVRVPCELPSHRRSREILIPDAGGHRSTADPIQRSAKPRSLNRSSQTLAP